MKQYLGATALSLTRATGAFAECGTVRFSDVGWTDITATTAVTTTVLHALHETHPARLRD